jgi:hypothetical protein
MPFGKARLHGAYRWAGHYGPATTLLRRPIASRPAAMGRSRHQRRGCRSPAGLAGTRQVAHRHPAATPAIAIELDGCRQPSQLTAPNARFVLVDVAVPGSIFEYGYRFHHDAVFSTRIRHRAASALARNCLFAWGSEQRSQFGRPESANGLDTIASATGIAHSGNAANPQGPDADQTYEKRSRSDGWTSHGKTSPNYRKTARCARGVGQQRQLS